LYFREGITTDEKIKQFLEIELNNLLNGFLDLSI
jgi:hypothetical protein